MNVSRAKTAGDIRILNTELAKDIISCQPSVSRVSTTAGNVHKAGSFASLALRNEDSQMSSNQYVSCHHINGWLSEQSVKSIQEKTDYESREIKKMYLNLLQNEASLNKEVEDLLVGDIVKKHNKCEELFERWSERTYAPLNEKIQAEVNSKKFQKFKKGKRSQYEKYLDHRNKRGHIFLDVYEKDEYDPMLNKERPGPLKAVVGKLRDPLSNQKDRRNEEEKLVIACNTGEFLSDKQIESLQLPPLPLIPLGRHGTQCKTWLEMKLTDIQSEVRAKSQARLFGIRNNASFTLEETSRLRSDMNVLDGRIDCTSRRRRFAEKYDCSILLE